MWDEQGRVGQSVLHGVLLGQKPDAEANELEHRWSLYLLLIRPDQQEQLALRTSPPLPFLGKTAAVQYCLHPFSSFSLFGRWISSSPETQFKAVRAFINLEQGGCSTALRAKAKPEAIAVPNSACKRTQWYFAMNISVLSWRRGLKLCQCKFAPSFFRETRGRRATYLVIFQYVVHGKRRSTGDPENYRRNGWAINCSSRSLCFFFFLYGAVWSVESSSGSLQPFLLFFFFLHYIRPCSVILITYRLDVIRKN